MYSLKTLILRTFKIKTQIKHELTTLLTTAEAGCKTSIDRSDMCSCSFAEENRQNVGCTSSSRGLNVDEFLIRLIKYEKSTGMFLTACTFLSGVSNRTFGFRTQSNENRTIKYYVVRSSNEIELTKNKCKSNQIEHRFSSVAK